MAVLYLFCSGTNETKKKNVTETNSTVKISRLAFNVKRFNKLIDPSKKLEKKHLPTITPISLPTSKNSFQPRQDQRQQLTVRLQQSHHQHTPPTTLIPTTIILKSQYGILRHSRMRCNSDNLTPLSAPHVRNPLHARTKYKPEEASQPNPPHNPLPNT